MSLMLLKSRAVRFSIVQDPSLTQQSVDTTATRITNFLDQYVPQLNTDFVNRLLGIDSQDFLELKGVTDIRFEFNSDVAVEAGLEIAFIQPWYIKPANISISGHSYIGAYQYLSKTDNDIADFFQKYSALQDEKTLSTTAQRFKLEIINNPTNLSKYYGFITKLDFRESQDNPYMLFYNINFVGVLESNFAVSMALRRSDSDLKNVFSKGVSDETEAVITDNISTFDVA